MTQQFWFGVAVGAVGMLLSWAAIVIAVLWWFATPRSGEVPEDEGPEYDGGIEIVCWHCGKHISGPRDGQRQPTRECWDCYCQRTGPDDNPAIPHYVAAPKGVRS
jgi:hypothetical protein